MSRFEIECRDILILFFSFAQQARPSVICENPIYRSNKKEQMKQVEEPMNVDSKSEDEEVDIIVVDEDPDPPAQVFKNHVINNHLFLIFKKNLDHAFIDCNADRASSFCDKKRASGSFWRGFLTRFSIYHGVII